MHVAIKYFWWDFTKTEMESSAGEQGILCFVNSCTTSIQTIQWWMFLWNQLGNKTEYHEVEILFTTNVLKQ